MRSNKSSHMLTTDEVLDTKTVKLAFEPLASLLRSSGLLILATKTVIDGSDTLHKIDRHGYASHIPHRS